MTSAVPVTLTIRCYCHGAKGSPGSCPKGAYNLIRMAREYKSSSTKNTMQKKMTRTVYSAWTKGTDLGKEYVDLRDGAVELSLEMVGMAGVEQRWRKTEKNELCYKSSCLENWSCSYIIRTGIPNARLKTKGEITRSGNSQWRKVARSDCQTSI